MIEPGHYHELRVLRETSVGLYLGYDESEAVLLPWKYVPPQAKIGDELRVFVYKDGLDRPVATTLAPGITRNGFGCLRVSHVNSYGAFLDWGLEKDLFVPFKEQPQPMEVDKWYVVYMYFDDVSERLVASGRVARYLDKTPPPYKAGDEVEVMIWEATDLGYNVIVDRQFRGLVYHKELFSRVKIGDIRRGYVKQLRPDHKLDILLSKPGHEQIEPNAQHLLDKLRAAKGFLPLHDNSPPEQISRILEMSKKSFKKAAGTLYKQRLIAIEPDGIRLL